MATHSSVLAWRIPGTGEPGGLPSMGSHRVGCHLWGCTELQQHGHNIVRNIPCYSFNAVRSVVLSPL